MEKGRPPKTEVNNFDFNELELYYTDNQKKEENIPKDYENLNSEFGAEKEKDQELKYEITESNEFDEYINLDGFISIDKNSIKMADLVISSALENLFKFIGFEKEVEAMSDVEVKFFEKNLPPLKIKRNWKNIIFIYLFTKLK